MRIDIIVPNFDDSSDEVTISAWYKKIGDKISKGEIIADAETPSVACGITSSYDCILAKILTKDGEIVSQGTKIAVIETDVNADISDIIENIERAEGEAIAEVVGTQIQEEEKILSELDDNNEEYSLSVKLDEESGKEIAEEKAIIEEEIIEELSEHTEEKCLNILKNAENQAKEEAAKLKEKILEETRKAALQQAEELKAKILKECEEKASRDAAEMHKKIIDGSVLEAENTKAKLIKEAEQKAHDEAENIKNEIANNAEKEAKLKAENTIQEAIAQAKEEAKLKAEELSKEILEKSINEAKLEAKAIKKDIIHSARKYAAKESADIVKEVIKEARAKSHLQAEELIESTSQLASQEAKLLRREILENACGDIVEEIEKKPQEKNSCDKDLKMRSDLYKKVMKEKDNQTKEQTEIIKKLLNIESNDSASELYADNWNKPKFFESPEDYNEPIDMLKSRISERMRDSYDASVISTVSNEVDMSAILALEKTFGTAFSKKHNTRLGFTPFFISACVAALKQYRIFNAHIHEDEVIYKNNFDISVITCGNDGITAPVIRNVDVLTIAEIEKSMIHLSKRAMEGTLSVEEVSGGTFTVINAGIYGSLIGTDLLTPPQVATLSVHKMHNRPIATDQGMEIKPMLYISLSYDHRISDTRKASEFLSNVKNYVENPGWQVLGLS
ncbi:MAG: 2-oxo acid dehydrogenase subunit E2 [Holosporaceae bacterium]|jgi:2-oxoglutarate dehydrogenase E2 component (dihydrolipoamide succinyltransferase)|nr:2-oxo acid dehydrogenase subunit E2 [Holosporaceae bacterium]